MRFLYTLPAETNINFTTGADKLLLYVSQEVPILMPMFFTFVFMVIMLGGFFNEQRRRGEGSIAQWSAIAGYITLLLAIFISLSEGLVSPTILGSILAVSLISTVWFMMSKNS